MWLSKFLPFKRKEKYLTIMIDLSKASASLAKIIAADAAVEALIVTLNVEIKTISAASTDPATQAALDELTAQIDAKTDELVAATVAGTPSDPAAPVV